MKHEQVRESHTTLILFDISKAAENVELLLGIRKNLLDPHVLSQDAGFWVPRGRSFFHFPGASSLHLTTAEYLGEDMVEDLGQVLQERIHRSSKLDEIITLLNPKLSMA